MRWASWPWSSSGTERWPPTPTARRRGCGWSAGRRMPRRRAGRTRSPRCWSARGMISWRAATWMRRWIGTTGRRSSSRTTWSWSTGSPRCWTSSSGRSRRRSATGSSSIASSWRRSRRWAMRTRSSRTRSRVPVSGSSCWRSRRADTMLRRWSAALLLALALGGCAGLFSSFDVAPSGLRTSDDRLRRMLASGRAGAALEQLAPEGEADPGDALLRALYAGIVAHYAGEYELSNAAFELAVELSEDRRTTSVSRSALSLVASDRALPFQPSPSERLLIPYYAALNYLELGDTEGAAVEARRLSALLERYRTDDRADRRLHGLLRAFAGAVFEAAGERNDADVAYRNALALGVDSVLAPTGDVRPAPDSLGDVVVLIERGFVAHRVEQGLAVLLLPEEIEVFDEGDAEERAALAAHIAARVVAHAAESLPYTGRRPATLFVTPPEGYTPPRPRRLVEECERAAANDTARAAKDSSGSRTGAGTTRTDDKSDRCSGRERNPYLLRIAWPAYRRPAAPAAPLAVTLPDGRAEPLRATADLSDAVIRDFQAERAAIVARTIARGITKLLVSRAMESELAEKDETAGRIAGLIGNVGTALLEQADTRSWHLLPGSLGMTRVRLPAGTHALSVPDADGSSLDIGQVEVRPGRVTFVVGRTFR